MAEKDRQLDAIVVMVNAAQAACEPGQTPDLTRDDILIYSGSATWDQWENHVPQAVKMIWPQLDGKARLAVFLTAKQITTYNYRAVMDQSVILTDESEADRG